VRIVWSPIALEEYKTWNDEGRKRINELIESIEEHGPLQGLGKPERLRYDLSGWFSRRITKEHRLVYRVSGGMLEIIGCMYHYGRN
jgi:toxin YoeB